MGLLDAITKQVLGGGSSQDLLMNALMGLLNDQKGGGIGGLVKLFSSQGMGDIVNSWVGTGSNLPVTPQQIQKGLGGNVLGQVAKQAGISTDDAASQLARLLPQVIDQLTPNGKVPQGDIMQQGLSILKGLMK